MSTLEHRLQVLINENQKAALERESEATGRSVGAVIREAIDLRYATETNVKVAALEWILEQRPARDEAWMDWTEIKAGITADLDARISAE